MKNYNLKLYIFLLIILFLFPMTTFGAVLYLDPDQGEYQENDTFIAEIKINTEGECINTVKADLSFPSDHLEVVDFSQGGSLLLIWLQSPQVDQRSGRISFTGGVPGGFCGMLPGDPGESNLLGKIAFRIKGESRVEFLDTCQVLLNDGLGTLARLTNQGAVFTISAEKLEGRDEWQEELEKDKIPPEPFGIEIHQDPAIFEGEYFIIFSTTDKQTGIAYYQVKEGRRGWQEAASPYPLKDQGLRSAIKVKAVDKAGNERIIEIPSTKESVLHWWIILILLTGLAWWLIRRFRSKKRNKSLR